jgi:acetylornithine deacetylase/succinyl-diaminopimelate desuccinylase-like protein
MELSQSESIVETMLEVADDTGHGRRLGGLDSWYDGATLTTLAQIPSIGYGPPGFNPDGTTVAHTVDEFVPVDGLVRCAQGLAVAAMRFCGLA